MTVDRRWIFGGAAAVATGAALALSRKAEWPWSTEPLKTGETLLRPKEWITFRGGIVVNEMETPVAVNPNTFSELTKDPNVNIPIDFFGIIIVVPHSAINADTSSKTDNLLSRYRDDLQFFAASYSKGQALYLDEGKADVGMISVQDARVHVNNFLKGRQIPQTEFINLVDTNLSLACVMALKQLSAKANNDTSPLLVPPNHILDKIQDNPPIRLLKA